MIDLAIRIARTVDLFRKASWPIAFSGAGISTESGLADFRSPGGLWDRYRIVTYQEFLASREARVEYWTMRRELIAELLRAQPNAAHRALAALEQLGRLQAVITQNIDGLHQMAGSREVIELHGTNRTASCLSCGRSWPIERIQEHLLAGNLDPHCETCDGLVKPDTVSFGQAMPEEAMLRAYRHASRCDLFLMIGSSLEVQPAASLPVAARQEGARLVFINRTATPLDELATVRFREGAGEVLSRIAEDLEEQ
jgi:NAD-dependent deacetylase